MKQEILVGQTDYTVLVLIRTTAGAPATALTEASVDIAYARVETDNDVTTTDVTPAALAALTTAHTDWGLEEVSATDHPGLYRLDIADAVFASGAWSAVVSVVGTGLDPCQIEFILVNHSPFSAVADILTDTGTTLQGELDAIEADVDAILVDTNEVQISLAAGGLIESMVDDLQTEVDGIQADTEDIQARLPAALVSGRMDSSVGAMAANVMTAAAAAADLTTELQSGLATAAALATVDGIVDDILLDTAEIGAAGAGLTALASQASVNTIDDLLDTEIPALTTAVADLPTNAELATALGTADDAVLAAIAALENLSAAEVNAEVVDALATDTYAEPGQGTPAATAALSAKIGYLYKAWRNRTTQTASEYALYGDDAVTKDQEAAISDDGVTLVKGEVATGA